MERSLKDRLLTELRSWRPDQEDEPTLEGVVVELGTFIGDYGESPTVTVLTDDGDELIWNVFGTVAEKQFGQARLEVGNRVGIGYLGWRNEGKEGAYKNWRVINLDRHSKKVEATSEETPEGASQETGSTADAGDVDGQADESDIPF